MTPVTTDEPVLCVNGHKPTIEKNATTKRNTVTCSECGPGDTMTSSSHDLGVAVRNWELLVQHRKLYNKNRATWSCSTVPVPRAEKKWVTSARPPVEFPPGIGGQHYSIEGVCSNVIR